MTETTNLALPLIAASQAQKHVTHNEALTILDAMVQLSVLDRNLTAPPAGPADGDRYIVAAGATDAWAGQDNNIAVLRDGVWFFLVPKQGWSAYVADEQVTVTWTGAIWLQKGLVFTPGGDGVVSIYRTDSNSGQNPRTATIGSIAADIITLSAAVAETIFSDAKMAGVSYLRIWNTTKVPNESAWVKAQPAADQLQVLDAGDTVTWSPGDTIQAGDPTAEQPGRVIAIDISPMMQAVLGIVTRQQGIMVKSSIASATPTDSISLTSDGSSGSFVGAAQYLAGAGTNGSGVAIVPCTLPSPISNSNLVLVRESIETTGDVRLVSSLALFF